MNRINLSESELAALAARIQRNYSYDPERGLLVNRKTGRVVKGTFRNAQKQKYRSFDFWHGDEVRHLNYHWVVWAWHNGCFPTMQLDHLDLDPTNNKIENLREVTQSENMLNMEIPWKPNKDTGLPGICPHGRGYETKIHGKNCYFPDPFEAFFHQTLLGRRFK